jgi:hypothetical protein
VCEAEARKEREPCKRRSKRQKLNKGNYEEWEARKKDIEIRDQLSSDTCDDEAEAMHESLQVMEPQEA